MRNHKSRISLIKQFTMYNYSMGIESYVNRIGGNSNVAEERFESLNIVNCDRSLIYGDIGFGDDELN